VTEPNGRGSMAPAFFVFASGLCENRWQEPCLIHRVSEFWIALFFFLFFAGAVFFFFLDRRPGTAPGLLKPYGDPPPDLGRYCPAVPIREADMEWNNAPAPFPAQFFGAALIPGLSPDLCDAHHPALNFILNDRKDFAQLKCGDGDGI